ncbi:hypothetical protein PhCBS80983_g00683 [Powellomyces hirtus]|uniref:Ferritin n=1 Tax=Powellomyces hirtus TaxID=109895 RepID=A0A507EFT5_9FUNG|nr:hypothetical protein PhCBS80983_g00683 [Powellomyces hirtus]
MGAMRVSNKILDGLIKQANRELASSSAYLSMSLWFADREFPGSAKWCRTHADEERGHGLKIFDHITKRRAKGALILPQAAQKFDFENPVDVWKFALENETANSTAIQALFKQSRDEGDYTTENFMQWYLNEQLEEEAAISDILENAKRVLKTNGLYVTFDSQIVAKPH